MSSYRDAAEGKGRDPRNPLDRYGSCRFCGNRGCLACDRFRAMFLREQVQREEAENWLHDQIVERTPDGNAITRFPGSLEQLTLLVLFAIEHGENKTAVAAAKQQQVGALSETGAPAASDIIVRRFALLELDPSDDAITVSPKPETPDDDPHR